MLILSVLLGIIPLLGVGLIFYQAPALTVDNLFVSLMLLAISAVFMLNAALELKARRAARKAKSPPEPEKNASQSVPSGGATTRAVSAAAAAKPMPASAPKPEPHEAAEAVVPVVKPALAGTEVTKVQGGKAEPRQQAVTVSMETVSAVMGTARGLVCDVQFFEGLVGQPNKSIVSLRANGDRSARLFAFEGDLRSALPVGKKVEISYRQSEGAYDLQGVNYL